MTRSRLTILISLVSTIILLGFNSEPAYALDPANPNASEDARKLLDWIADLPNRSNNRVISGQNLSHTIQNVESGYSKHVSALHSSSGKWVGMLGAGYGAGCTAGQISAGNQKLIDWWNNGYLITIWYPVNNPWTGGNQHDLTDRNLVRLITPGTAVNNTWMAELDKVAKGLAELRDAGVVVLWRPFHEMTYKNTFWWDAGAHPDNPQPYINMWKHMFDYFTYTKGLDNLLWVYSAANLGDWSPADSLYPGGAYVDVVGIDVYSDSMSIKEGAYSRLVNLGKPFALTEIGPGSTTNGTWDNTNTINKIKASYPKTTYFLQWHSWTGNSIAIADNRNASGLLNDPWVITRDELNWRSTSVPTSVPTSAPSPSPSTGTIIDNTDPGFSTSFSQDTWQTYTQVGGKHYGSSHVFNEQTGIGSDTATWTFTLDKVGLYEVYAWWWDMDYRPTNVPYTINHYGGVDTVRVNQTRDGGSWNLLGEYYFDKDTTYSVTVSDNASGGRALVADAIRVALKSETSLPSLPGDLDEDGDVDTSDLKIVGDSFGKAPGDAGYDSRADADNSGGVIDIFDLVTVGGSFGGS